MSHSRVLIFRGHDATSRAISAVGILLVLGIVAVAITAIVQLNRQSERVTRQRVQGQALSLAAHAEEALAAADFVLQTIQHDVAASDVRDPAGLKLRFNTAQQNDLLLFRQGSFHPIELVVIADASGRMVSFSRHLETPDISLADRDYFLEAKASRADRPVVSAPVMSRISGQLDFFLARKLQTADGRFLGVAAVGLSSNYFSTLYEDLRLGREDPSRQGMSSIALVRSDDTVLAASPAGGIVGDARSAARSSPRSAKGEDARFDVVTQRVRGFPVAVTVTTDPAFHSAVSHRQSLLIGCLAALAVTGIGYTFVALARVLRRREEMFVENQRLRATAEAASKAKSQFLATVSHEIRTPMNGIIGAAELLSARDLPDEAHRLAAMLLRSGRNLLGMLNDVLDFSRIEAGELHISPATFDPRALVREVAELFHAFATTKGLEIETDVGQEVPRRLIGDVARIRQILSNLVGNAVKFTDTGFVVIRASVGPSDGTNATLVFEVEDSGIGIPVEAQDRIFEAFAQADSSVERRFGGSGLGLAISRRLALLMNGRLGFTTQHRGGSCFHLTLPLVEATADPVGATEPCASASDVRAPAATPALPALHVLVTEDNPVNAMVVEAQLESLGCTCDVAVDGEDALAHLSHHRYDVVLMDCMLPGMSGYDATRSWREREAREALAPLPIIALTANALSSNVEHAREAGMDDFLTKPCALEDLRGALHRATGRRSADAYTRAASQTGHV